MMLERVEITRYFRIGLSDRQKPTVHFSYSSLLFLKLTVLQFPILQQHTYIQLSQKHAFFFACFTHKHIAGKTRFHIIYHTVK